MKLFRFSKLCQVDYNEIRAGGLYYCYLDIFGFGGRRGHGDHGGHGSRRGGHKRGRGKRNGAENPISSAVLQLFYSRQVILFVII
ncbi:hypothetical protein AYI69_g1527 [Smittium culicis]|uniref:Uncharacterized protein n=1 Tax=Smittium culicis TaxID=133412 RepID=A0A1R1YQ22_9FUNG|nr:hypothetical protein AYI69_g1527 [Smittium culicis]